MGSGPWPCAHTPLPPPHDAVGTIHAPGIPLTLGGIPGDVFLQNVSAQSRCRADKKCMNEICKQNAPSRLSLSSRFRMAACLNTVRAVWHLARGLFPLTWMAVIAAVLIYFVWYWEVMPHANQILHAVALMWIAFGAILITVTLLGAILVFVKTRRQNRHVILNDKNEVGGRIDSDYRVYRAFFLPFVTVECALVEDIFRRHPRRARAWEGEYLEPVGRGRLSALHRTISVRDIFGMTEISFTLKQSVDIEIAPASGHFEQYVFKSHSSGEDGYSHPDGSPKGDLVEMRRYQAGDPLRLVLWRVFARSRKLVVRMPEPTITEQNDMFVYFVSGAQDEESASVARSFLATFDDDGACFAADGAQRLVRNATEGLSDVIDSARFRHQGAQGLMDVAPLLQSGKLAHCFLLVPRQIGTWIDRVRTFVGAYPVRPTFILSVDSRKAAPSSKKNSVWTRLWRATERDDIDSDSIQDVCEKLLPMGEVRIVDIATGAFSEVTQARSARP